MSYRCSQNMAENIAGSSQSGDKDDRDVFATLRKATNSLNKVADLLRGNGRGHAIRSEAFSSTIPCSPTTVIAASPSPLSGLFSEHRRLFGNAADVPTVESTK